MTQLSNKTFTKRIKRPVRIVQFGGGNFLRGFADWMIEVLNQTTDFNSDVAIVKPTERGDYTALRKQDGLFQVLLQGIKDGEYQSQLQLIQCVQQVVHPYKEWKEYLKLAENPNLRFIISNTTEAGIKFSTTDQLSDQPAKEFPGKLTAFLYHRFLHFKGAADKTFIFLPCELIEQNGATLKSCIIQYADSWKLDPAFKRWMDGHIFCNTLVDRIVSGFPNKTVIGQNNLPNVKDDLLVAGEPYHSWIIEGPKEVETALPFHRTKLNVKFVEDLGPYRKIKVRLLNGAHTALVPVGYLYGVRTVKEAMQESPLEHFMQQILADEIIPSLEFEKTELEQFSQDVLDRFRNPSIEHELKSIALNSISKFKTRLLPSLLQYQTQKGQLPERIVFALACLIQFYKGNYQDIETPVQDDPATMDFFKKVWKEHGKDKSKLVKQVLSKITFWDMNLSNIPGLQELLTDFLIEMENSTIRSIVKRIT